MSIRVWVQMYVWVWVPMCLYRKDQKCCRLCFSHYQNQFIQHGLKRWILISTFENFSCYPLWKNCWFTKVASWYAPPDKSTHCQLSPCCNTIRVMWEVIWAHWEGWLDLATSVLSNLTIWQNSPLSSSCNSTREIWAHWEGWFGEMNLYQHQLFCHIWQNSPLTSSCNREMWEVIWVHWEGWLGIGLLSWMFGHRQGRYSILNSQNLVFGYRLGEYFSKSSAKINFGDRPGGYFHWLKLIFEICASIQRCSATDQDIFLFSSNNIDV